MVPSFFFFFFFDSWDYLPTEDIGVLLGLAAVAEFEMPIISEGLLGLFPEKNGSFQHSLNCFRILYMVRQKSWDFKLKQSQ